MNYKYKYNKYKLKYLQIKNLIKKLTGGAFKHENPFDLLQEQAAASAAVEAEAATTVYAAETVESAEAITAEAAEAAEAVAAEGTVAKAAAPKRITRDMFGLIKPELSGNITKDFINALDLYFDRQFLDDGYIFDHFKDVKKDMAETVSYDLMIKKEKQTLSDYLISKTNNLKDKAKMPELDFEPSEKIPKETIQDNLLKPNLIYILDRDGSNLDTDENKFKYGIPSDGLNHFKHIEFRNFIKMFNNLKPDKIINILEISLETYINRIFKELLTQLESNKTNIIESIDQTEIGTFIDEEIDECYKLQFKISIDHKEPTGSWFLEVYYYNEEDDKYQKLEVYYYNEKEGKYEKKSSFDITNKGTKGAAMDYIEAGYMISEQLGVKTKIIDALLIYTLGFSFKAYGDESYLHMLILIALLSIENRDKEYLFYSHDKNLTNNVFNLLPHLYTINPALQLEVYTRQKDEHKRDIYYKVPARR